MVTRRSAIWELPIVFWGEGVRTADTPEAVKTSLAALDAAAERAVAAMDDVLNEPGNRTLLAALNGDGGDPDDAGLREAVAVRKSNHAEAIGRNLLARLTVPIYISSGGSVTYALSSDANPYVVFSLPRRSFF